MKSTLKLFLFFFLNILLSCQPASDKSQKIIEIKKLISQYNKAFCQKDFQKFSSFCSEDFTFFTLDGQSFDKTTIASFLEKVLGRWQNVQIEAEDLDIQVDNNFAFARYLSVYKYVIDETYGAMNSRITVFFKRINGEWMLAHFHMSRSYQ